MPGTDLIAFAGPEDDGAALDLPSRAVFAHAGRAVDVSGPHLDEETARVHIGFWE